MKILVACEFSGRVREAFRTLGHDAWSCDLIPTIQPSPFHLQQDVLTLLDQYAWDAMIAFPDCTYLCSSGLHWNKRLPGREQLTHEAVQFAMTLMGDGWIAHKIPKIALENPIGRLSTAYRKPDQIIQPWMFGEDASKQTCLWLKGLPKLEPTQIVAPHYGCPKCRARLQGVLQHCPTCSTRTKKIWANQTPSGQNKLGPSADRAQLRSITYQGVASAMALQWGGQE